jgi:RHH-type proline utilization regulon transcriptional repressor/proline dehydrogenase/delta 1-pyrroline-5-carboxylate dehydrogenase
MARLTLRVSDLEERTRSIGRTLFALARRHGDAIRAHWLDDQLMDLSLRDPTVKAQLFRLIDVLPALGSEQKVADRLREYYEQIESHVPGPLRALGGWAVRHRWLGRRLGRVAQAAARRLARRFIAAADVGEASPAIMALRERRIAATLDLLGEAVLSGAEAERYQRTYIRLIEELSPALAAAPAVPQLDESDAGPLPRLNVSLKLSSLYSQFDPADPEGTSRAVRGRLRPVLLAARRHCAFVNFDMEHYALKDATLRIFRDVLEEEPFGDWADAGIAVQAYLRDTQEDLRRLCDWAQRRATSVWVRLVKGAYWEYETVVAAQNNWPVPVFMDKRQTDANFEAQTRFLLEHHGTLRTAIASHNVRSIAHALAVAEEVGLLPGALEFQMLYGMAEPIQQALVEMGHRVRVYAPWGQLLPGMAYLVRRLLENTSNESFLRASFVQGVSQEELLMNPLQFIRSTRPQPPGGDGRPAGGAFHNEPPTDFSQEQSRDAMRSALNAVEAELGAAYPLVIDGRRLSRDRTIDSTDPSDPSHIVGRAAAATVDDADAAVRAARSALARWRATPAQDRAGVLRRAAAILRRRRFELAAWEIVETAKQWREADADVAEAIDYCEFYAGQMLRLAAARRRDVAGEENFMLYEPRGVAVAIAPWNFALAILCGMTVAAIVTGNTVVMKPAEQSPVVAAMLMDILQEAGLPAGVCNYLPGIGEEVGPALVAHRDVDVIAFTGSRAVGLGINELAARTPAGQDHVKRVICEMGGKNAIIIDEDADLDEAVAGVVQSAFGYAGQKCSACSRAIALAAVYDAFLARLVEATRSLRIGPPRDPGNFVGPVIDAEARARIARAIEQARKESRQAYPDEDGPPVLPPVGHYVAPHIFADVEPSSALAQEEVFGPVLAVMRAADLDEALTITNATRYALTGGLYSRSPRNIGRVSRALEVGNLYINRRITGALVDRQPFGGFKLSGIGSKAGGDDYLLQFLIPRTVTQNTLRRGFAPGQRDTGPAAT